MPVDPEAPPSKATAVATLIPTNPVRRPLWLSVYLALVWAQALVSLFVNAGEFISSDDILVSPFRVCVRQDDGGRPCLPFQDTWWHVVVVVLLYEPVVVVAFALLAMMYAAYSKERSVLVLSGIFQAVSGLLLLMGIVGFLHVNWPYVAWGHMTLWFYACVGLNVELLITTVATFMSRKMM